MPRPPAANYTALVSSSNGVLTFQQPDNRGRRRILGAAEAGRQRRRPVDRRRQRLARRAVEDDRRHQGLAHPFEARRTGAEASPGACSISKPTTAASALSTTISAWRWSARPTSRPTIRTTVRCEPQEIDYLLESVRALLPGMTFGRDQIVYAYSGIRPLPASDASVPGLISRDHSAPVVEPDSSRPFPIISLVGGKWTTFRGFAEEVADTVLDRLGRSRKVDHAIDADRRRQGFSDRALRRAPPGWPMPSRLQAPTNAVSTRLLSRYGTKALQIARHQVHGTMKTACRTRATTARPKSTTSFATNSSNIWPISSCAARPWP